MKMTERIDEGIVMSISLLLLQDRAKLYDHEGFRDAFRQNGYPIQPSSCSNLSSYTSNPQQ